MNWLVLPSRKKKNLFPFLSLFRFHMTRPTYLVYSLFLLSLNDDQCCGECLNCLVFQILFLWKKILISSFLGPGRHLSFYFFFNLEAISVNGFHFRCRIPKNFLSRKKRVFLFVLSLSPSLTL